MGICPRLPAVSAYPLSRSSCVTVLFWTTSVDRPRSIAVPATVSGTSPVFARCRVYCTGVPTCTVSPGLTRYFPVTVIVSFGCSTAASRGGPTGGIRSLASSRSYSAFAPPGVVRLPDVPAINMYPLSSTTCSIVLS
ncbi:hypothetical protein C1I64_18275 [Rathayibacter festucae DSM 15932]|uniref:Uncharacterized protein n=1 Tax=Rathayibacter festucae DSM 15932 TaxID=1328866 RepID=A0A3Q9V0Y0_9MICO|nr:hypothetical protein C1I64_18275 [Rathayibacter festucae DSM 15932]